MARSLIQQDALNQKRYFEEILELYGIPSLYYQTKPGKTWTIYSELKSNYFNPIKANVIFDQVPSIRTLKKLGWVSELDEVQPILHISYDLPGLQIGCLFKIKDPMTETSGRIFRITKLSVGIIYPSSVTAQVVAAMGNDTEATVFPYTGDKSIFLNKEKGVD